MHTPTCVATRWLKPCELGLLASGGGVYVMLAPKDATDPDPSSILIHMIALSRRTKTTLVIVLLLGGLAYRRIPIHPTISYVGPTGTSSGLRGTRRLSAIDVHSDHWRTGTAGGSPTGALGPPFRLKVLIRSL